MKLSSQLQTKIDNNPLNTILRSDSEKKEKLLLKCKYQYSKRYNLPENFSGKEIWGSYWTPIYNQGKCGACYAFASTSMLADRFNIQSDGKYYVQLSPTKMILCSKEFQNPDSHETIMNEIIDSDQSYSDKILKENEIDNENYSCKGNTLYNALQYLYIFGVTDENCLPYTDNLGITDKEFKDLKDSASNTNLPLCTYVTGNYADMCSDKTTPERLYRAYSIYAVPGVESQNGNEESIRQEIYKWGPVVSAFKVYPNFYTFDPKKEVYKWDGKGEQVGGHAIEITGWGVEPDGTKFWEITNSWGSDWGLNGFFKMLRGVNECEIEENVYAAIPDFFYPEGYIVGNDLINCIGKFINIRKELNTNTIKEGLDPTTGYSYRTMDLYKGKIDFTRPVPLDQLPNRDDFVAGELNPKYSMIKKNIKNVKKWVKENKKTCFIIIGIVVLIILGIIIYILLRNKKHSLNIENKLPYKNSINNPYYH